MKDKIPTPPTKKPLYLPVEFWAELLSIIDRKIQSLSEAEGYGKINVELVMQKGKITNVRFVDQVTSRKLIKKAERTDSKA